MEKLILSNSEVVGHESVFDVVLFLLFLSRDSTAAGQTADALLCGTGVKSVVDVPFELTFMRPAPPVYSCDDDVRRLVYHYLIKKLF